MHPTLCPLDIEPVKRGEPSRIVHTHDPCACLDQHVWDGEWCERCGGQRCGAVQHAMRCTRRRGHGPRHALR